MVKLAAAIIIACLLFGVEAVRAFMFGTLGVIGWALFILLCLAFLGWLIGGWDENIGKKPIENPAQAKKRQEAQNKAELRELEKLKESNPTEYHKIERRRKIAIASGILFIVVFACLIAALIITKK